jgi:hypothetical protein
MNSSPSLREFCLMGQNNTHSFDDLSVFHVNHFQKSRSVFGVSNCDASMARGLEHMNMGWAMIVWHDHYRKPIFINYCRHITYNNPTALVWQDEFYYSCFEFQIPFLDGLPFIFLLFICRTPVMTGNGQTGAGLAPQDP